MKVPYLDLKAQLKRIEPEIKEAVNAVIDSTQFVLGPAVEKFEKDFALFNDTKFCAGVNSGTSALHLALLAAGIKEGDEVITTPHTFVSTTWAISYAKAKPVFVDIEPDYYTIDPRKIEQAITEKTKAIIPVHLYGHPADLDPIKEICKKHNLMLIEDAAQAHGAMYKGAKCGSNGDAGCFSFYPGKNLGAYGEAGAVITNNEEISQKVKLYRNHYQEVRYHHDEISYNYRMEGFQGAVLAVKLKYIDQWNEERRQHANLYNELLAGVPGVSTPKEAPYAKHVYHVYAIKLESREKRDQLMIHLNENEIATNLHYPVPVHLQKAYAHLGHKKGDFPITEEAANTLLSLPMYPEMTNEMISYVCAKIKEWAG